MTIVETTDFFWNDLELSAIPLFRRDFETVAKTVAVWKQIAEKKGKLCSDMKEKERFEDCAWVCEILYHKLQGNFLSSKIYVCVDRYKNLQAVVEVTPRVSSMHIHFLVTHPHNIRSPVNDEEPDRVRGAGSTLIKKIEEIALARGKQKIDLYPLSGAIPFYEKQGFVQRSTGSMVKWIHKTESVALPLLAAG